MSKQNATHRAIEIALENTVCMRDFNGQFIQVGQFTTEHGTFNFLYDRSQKKGTYRNAQKPREDSIYNDNANMIFLCDYVNSRLIVTKIS